MIPSIFSRTSAAILGAVLLFAVQLQSAELVVNGGFEQSTPNNSPSGFPPGWTANDPSGFSGVASNPMGFMLSHSGNQYANLGGSAAPPNPPPSTFGTITQTLNTVAGAAYTLSFWLANDGDGSGMESFTVMFGTFSALIALPPNGGTFGPYTQFTFNLTAPTNSTTLQFRYINDSFYRLDDVSVQGPAGVPENGSTLLLALPILGALCVARFRGTRAGRLAVPAR
jgi:hypothetical protein